MKRTKYYNNNKYKAPYNNNTNTKFQYCYSLGLDLNINLGQGYGPFRLEGEKDLLPLATSVNIACGLHAGDPVLIDQCMSEIKQYNVSLGALIGVPDRHSLGNCEINLPLSDIRSYVLYQLGSLFSIAKAHNMEITQVRPAGYLYQQMGQDLRVATAVAKAISEFDKWLVLIGPPNENLNLAGQRADIRIAGEIIVDRNYDNSLNPLSDTNSRAKIKNTNEIINNIKSIIDTGKIKVTEGFTKDVVFQTIHITSQLNDKMTIAKEISDYISGLSPLGHQPFEIDSFDKVPITLYD